VLAVALLLILAGANAINLLRVARAVTVFDLEPMRELRALRGLAPGDEILHVRDESGTALLWVTYFLDDRPLVLGRDSPYYLHRRWPFYQEAITAPLVLVNRDAARPSPWAAATVHENDRYRVLRKDPAVLSYLDFDGAPRALAADQQFRLDFLADRTLIDGRSFPVAFPVGEGRTVAMGVWAVGGATLRVQDAHGARVLRVSGGEPLRWPASPRPAQATIANVGGETILLAGWAAVTERGPWPAGGEVTGGPLDVLRDEVVPGSGFFAVGGWHGPEGGVRWSRGSGVAVFANPGRAAPLRMDCLLWRPGLVEATRLALLVNGRPAGTPACSGAPEVFALSEALLGPLSWAMLEIRVDPVFVPQRAGVSTDPRELGVLVRSLRLEPAMGQGPGRGHP
jgi:hypothetical protein